MSETETTQVVFRMWKDEPHTVLALFPHQDAGGGHCGAYEHVGQHGAAHFTGCLSNTRLATPEEYEGLAKELRERGYVLNIVSRSTPDS